MHASQYIVHAEISNEDGEEGTDHVDVIKARLAEETDGCAMKRDCINHQCDKCP